jgi:hypothetical protein
MPLYLLNNCRNRDHVKLFGEGAFYDVDANGSQGNWKGVIRQGDHCIVATREKASNKKVLERKVYFRTFELETTKTMSAKNEGPNDVFFGRFIEEFSCLQREAINMPPYSFFFNCNGYFLMRSVITIN